MRFVTYGSAGAFLNRAQLFLEAEEAVNSLPLGLAAQLDRTPDSVKSPPFFATIEDGTHIRCAAVMTPPRPILLYTDTPEADGACQALVEGLSCGGWSVSGALAPSELAAEFASVWTARTGLGNRVRVRMTAYELRRVSHPPDPGGYARVATADDLKVVTEWMLGFNRDVGEPLSAEEVKERIAAGLPAGEILLWERGGPVSMARKVRQTRTGTCVSGVYTPPELRGKGYAAACVAALSQSLLDAGNQFCMLFADVDNPTSNGIYQRIGYKPLRELTHYVFDAPTA